MKRSCSQLYLVAILSLFINLLGQAQCNVCTVDKLLYSGMVHYVSDKKWVLNLGFDADFETSCYLIPANRKQDKIFLGAGFDGFGNFEYNYSYYNVKRITYKLGYVRYEIDGPVSVNWQGSTILEKGFIEKDPLSTADCNGVVPGCKVSTVSPLDTEAYYQPSSLPYAEIKVTEPQARFKVTWTSTLALQYDIYPVGYSSGTTNFRASARFIVMSEPEHFHHGNNKPIFSNKLSANNEFQVVADGSTASTFVVKSPDPSVSMHGFTLRIKGDQFGQNPTYNGRLKIIRQTTDSLIVEYQHPQAVPDSLRENHLTLQLMVGYDYDPSFLMEYPITVHRAPVLFTHGLWSDSTAFNTMRDSLVATKRYASNLLYKLDYKASNHREFRYNMLWVPAKINQIINELIRKNISVGKIDYVGHSMGGILGRLYIQSDIFSNDINKLITINTPHAGSEMANFLKDITNPSLREKLCSELIPNFLDHMGCDGGAITDLQVDSKAIREDLNGAANLNNYKVPSHAIVTISGISSADVDEVPKLLLRDELYALSFFLSGVGQGGVQSLAGAIFNNLSHDLVVSQESQRGGLTGLAWTLIEDQKHTGSPANPVVIRTVNDLLKAKSTSSKFTLDGFHPPTLTYTTPPVVSTLEFVNAIRINQPLQAISVLPNSILRLVISSRQPSSQASALESGEEISSIRALVRYNDDSIYVAKTLAASASYSLVTGTQPGKYEIFVLAKTSAGRYTTATSYFYVGAANAGQCASVQSGNWTASSTWSCGHEPTLGDIIVINPGHIVTVSTATAQAKQIIFNGGAIRYSSQAAKVFIEGKD